MEENNNLLSDQNINNNGNMGVNPQMGSAPMPNMGPNPQMGPAPMPNMMPNPQMGPAPMPNMGQSPQMGPVPMPNTDVNPETNPNAGITEEEQIKKPSKQSQVIGTVVTLVIVGFLAIWFIKRYCIF